MNHRWYSDYPRFPVKGVRALSGFVTKLKAAFLKAFWSTVFTDKVRPFVWVYYAALLIWGIYGTFFSAPATYVQPVMGHVVYSLWVWLHIAGTLIVISGLWLEGRTNTDGADTPLEKVAVQLQTGGHACMFFVLFGYEVSAITATAFGEGVYSIFVIAPYVLGCLMLTVQGIARIAMGRRPE